MDANTPPSRPAVPAMNPPGSIGDNLAVKTGMRCPECKTANEADAHACQHCGLLLTVLPKPSRRRQDFNLQHRRSADSSVRSCPFCKREVPGDAIHCPHCAEIVDAEYQRERYARRRSHVNHASWMAYLFGLVAFVVFRPVGVVAIGAGLLLSIVYYALPTGEETQSRISPLRRLRKFIRHAFHSERVSISIPRLPKLRLVLVGTPLIAAFIGLLANFFLLQAPMNQVLHENSAFGGIKVSAHYLYWMVPGVVVYNLEDVDHESRLDVHTAFLEFARKMKDRRFNEVELRYDGQTKFSMTGDLFHRLGEAYAQHDYAFVLYDFPRLLSHGQGPTDGRDALIHFHDQWYGNDVMRSALGKAAAAQPPPAPSPARAHS